MITYYRGKSELKGWHFLDWTFENNIIYFGMERDLFWNIVHTYCTFVHEIWTCNGKWKHHQQKAHTITRILIFSPKDHLAIHFLKHCTAHPSAGWFSQNSGHTEMTLVRWASLRLLWDLAVPKAFCITPHHTTPGIYLIKEWTNETV